VDVPPDPANQQELQEDEDARYVTVLYVGPELSHHVSNATSCQDAWQSLEQQLNQERRVRATILAAEVSKLSQAHSESIDSYLNRTQLLMV
jgi:MarR-like DNA-binding transcriptional regulator SgrR of sgrS sRNA